MRTHASPPSSDSAARGAVAWPSATAIVIGNMIGTGVFTSLGFQVAEIRSAPLIVLIWLVGGIVSLCGGLTYAELASALPRSGGEYHLLSRLYHPAAGFLAGWISLTVGFAAPVALAAMAFGAYLSGVFPAIGALPAAVALTLATCCVFLCPLRVGSRFLNAFVILKIAILLTLTAAAFGVASGPSGSLSAWHGGPAVDGQSLGVLGPLSIALIYVLYSYSGWNASIYVTEEVADPRRNVPRSVILGTLVVTALYLGINAAFLYSTPAAEMAGKIEVGLIAARRIFGTGGGNLMSLLICIGLVSSIGAMTWAGPRVAQVMGEDYPLLRPLARKNRFGVPYCAVLLQTGIVLLMLQTSTFEAVLTFMEVLLIASTSLTVAGVFRLRRRNPGSGPHYRAWGYPVTPLLFLGMNSAVILFVAWQRPRETLAGAIALLLGLLLYAAARHFRRTPRNTPRKTPR